METYECGPGVCSCAASEAAARGDGRVAPEDSAVSMTELKGIWAELNSKDVLYNGMTGDALRERYGDRLYHVMGVGWFTRPEGS